MFERSDLRLLATVAHVVTGLAVLVVWIGISESPVLKDFWLQPNDVNVIFLRGHLVRRLLAMFLAIASKSMRSISCENTLVAHEMESGGIV